MTHSFLTAELSSVLTFRHMVSSHVVWHVRQRLGNSRVAD
uniref:Uncharacterized protein n=1 Tax=Oryza punctata TaxID=4537 RepID=A0A0E0MH31_ORYPU